MKLQTVSSLEDVARLESLVVASAEATTTRLRALLAETSGVEALSFLKFSTAGCDPLDQERCLNLVEQLNQSLHLSSYPRRRSVAPAQTPS